jgi:ATP-dependent DNA ligase
MQHGARNQGSGRPHWVHESKHDGYRPIIQREGKFVRLFTRNGHDWSDRYPLIVEAAPKEQRKFFRHRWRGGLARRRWHLRFQ